MLFVAAIAAYYFMLQRYNKFLYSTNISVKNDFFLIISNLLDTLLKKISQKFGNSKFFLYLCTLF